MPAPKPLFNFAIDKIIRDNFANITSFFNSKDVLVTPGTEVNRFSQLIANNPKYPHFLEIPIETREKIYAHISKLHATRNIIKNKFKLLWEAFTLEQQAPENFLNIESDLTRIVLNPMTTGNLFRMAEGSFYYHRNIFGFKEFLNLLFNLEIYLPLSVFLPKFPQALHSECIKAYLFVLHSHGKILVNDKNEELSQDEKNKLMQKVSFTRRDISDAWDKHLNDLLKLMLESLPVPKNEADAVGICETYKLVDLKSRNSSSLDEIKTRFKLLQPFMKKKSDLEIFLNNKLMALINFLWLTRNQLTSLPIFEKQLKNAPVKEAIEIIIASPHIESSQLEAELKLPKYQFLQDEEKFTQFLDIINAWYKEFVDTLTEIMTVIKQLLENELTPNLTVITSIYNPHLNEYCCEALESLNIPDNTWLIHLKNLDISKITDSIELSPSRYFLDKVISLLRTHHETADIILNKLTHADFDENNSDDGDQNNTNKNNVKYTREFFATLAKCNEHEFIERLQKKPNQTEPAGIVESYAHSMFQAAINSGCYDFFEKLIELFPRWLNDALEYLAKKFRIITDGNSSIALTDENRCLTLLDRYTPDKLNTVLSPNYHILIFLYKKPHKSLLSKIWSFSSENDQLTFLRDLKQKNSAVNLIEDPLLCDLPNIGMHCQTLEVMALKPEKKRDATTQDVPITPATKVAHTATATSSNIAPPAATAAPAQAKQGVKRTVNDLSVDELRAAYTILGQRYITAQKRIKELETQLAAANSASEPQTNSPQLCGPR